VAESRARRSWRRWRADMGDLRKCDGRYETRRG
jgi:hypothetical protein